MGRVIFAADDGVHGRELFVSDGTSEETVLLKDILAGGDGSDPRDFVTFGQLVLFKATNATGATQLWVSDGTTAGTRLLITPVNDNVDSYDEVEQVTVVGDKAYFVARGATGYELYITDGTSAGTHIVKDIAAGTAAGATPSANLVVGTLGDKLVFLGDDGVNGRELWITDGTAAGTFMLADVNPGAGDIRIEPLLENSRGPLDQGVAAVAADGKLFFLGGAGNTLALWVTDGTTSGTTVIAPVGDMYGNGVRLVGMSGDALLFTQAGELWVSDGTSAGTVELGNLSGAYSFAQLGDRYVFEATSGVSDSEIWITDGTAAGTKLLKTIAQGAAGWHGPSDLTTVGEKVVFTTWDGTQESLWITDGATAGTRLIASSPFGGEGDWGLQFHGAVGDKVLFSKVVGSHEGWPLVELWVTDGRANGSVKLQDGLIGGDGYGDGEPFLPKSFYALGDRTVFVAGDREHGIELWVTDGTAAGTHLLFDSIPGRQNGLLAYEMFAEFSAVDGLLYFNSLSVEGGVELWVTDGTTAGTHLVKDIATTPDGSPSTVIDTDHVVAFGVGGVFATESDEVPGAVWYSDGTASGAVKLADVDVRDLVVAGESIFFTGVDSSTPDQVGLWVSDGTAAGTHSVLVFPTEPYFGASYELTVLGDRVVFSHHAGNSIFHLWISDGTQAGTFEVSEKNGYDFTAVGDRLVFTTWDGDGYALWSTDGTATGTVRLADVPNEYTWLQEVDGQLAFVAPGANGQSAIWLTDGTAAGTAVVHEPLNGASGVHAVGGKLYYRANDGVHGAELWVLDGAGSPSLVKDFTPGGASTSITFVDGEFDDGRMVIIVNNPVGGHTIWVTDGTEAGTVQVADLSARAYGDVRLVQILEDKLVFTYPPVGSSGFSQQDLWVSDGTAAGTVNAGPADMTSVYLPLGDGIVFSGPYRGGSALFFTDGTVGGSVALTGPSHPVGSWGATVFGDKVLFASGPMGTSDRELWISDGTTAGTMQLKDILPGSNVGGYPRAFVVYGDKVFFTADIGVGDDYAVRLWVTDGTAAGTHIFLDLDGLEDSYTEFGLQVINGKLVFMADDGVNGAEIYVSDGTVEGTHRVTDATQVGSSWPGPVVGLPTPPIAPNSPTAGNDTLTGTTRNDTIDGLGGNDVISGGDGADKLSGGLGLDTLNGDGGNDTLNGGDGIDTLNGGAGADVLYGDAGNDVLYGGDDNDRIYGGDGADTAFGGAGVDQIWGEGGRDTLYGDDGGDKLYGGDDIDRLFGGAGADLLYGDAGNDILEGGADGDKLYGGDGNDVLLGGEGNDILEGGVGADTMTGGVGNDSYEVNGLGDKVIELAGEGTDTVRASLTWTLGENVENLILLESANKLNGTGNALANTITGNSGVNVLDGGEGNDVLNGLGGDDRLTGGLGADRLNGGDGADRIIGGEGNDILNGGAGADRFVIGQESVGHALIETDSIQDFSTADGDILDLSLIDANSNLEGNQKFVLAGAFTKVAGQLTLAYTAASDSTVIKVDVNGDGKADYQIRINGDVTGDVGHWLL